MTKVLVIVNPEAGAGRARATVPRLTQSLDLAGVAWRLEHTQARGHATGLLRSLTPGSVDAVVVVGGDGTINEVCQAYVDAQGNPAAGPPLCFVPAGTGGDFRRTLQLPSEPESAVRRLLTSTPKPTDLGVAWVGGRPFAFANIVSFGLSGAVSEQVNRGSKSLGGKATFLLAALRANLTYDNPPVSLSLDGEPWYQGRVVSVAVANGQFFGGGMRIAPEANPHDGWLDVVLLGDASKAQRLLLTPHLYRGSHVQLPWVKTARAKRVSAQALREAEPLLVDLDGETPGELPLRVELLPGALQVYC